MLQLKPDAMSDAAGGMSSSRSRRRERADAREITERDAQRRGQYFLYGVIALLDRKLDFSMAAYLRSAWVRLSAFS